MSLSYLTPRVRRALLYLQGFDKRKIAKASSHPTLDCACLDMEDGVGYMKKDDARNGIIHALNNVDFGRTECLVRINGFETGVLAHQDLDAVISSEVLPDAIVISKVESPKDVNIVAERLDDMGDRAGSTRIVCMIESTIALLNMKEICTACPERMDCIIFGADDYASTIGASRTKLGKEMDFARNYALLHASAYGVSSIDMVQIDYHDEEHLKKESRESFELGFIGKQIIHPNQIGPVQEAYSPSMKEVLYAANVVEANEKHQKEGKGAFQFDGKMIDMPTVKQHQNLIYRAQQMGLI